MRRSTDGRADGGLLVGVYVLVFERSCREETVFVQDPAQGNVYDNLWSTLDQAMESIDRFHKS